jgi:hypothetical protein
VLVEHGGGVPEYLASSRMTPMRRRLWVALAEAVGMGLFTLILAVMVLAFAATVASYRIWPETVQCKGDHK